MKRKYADTVAVLLVAFVLVAGGIATWQAYQQWVGLSDMGGHMGGSASTIHGTHPVWFALGTLLTAAVISGVHLSVRDRLVSSSDSETVSNTGHSDPEGNTQSSTEEQSTASTSVTGTDSTSSQQVLDLLPDDERRILQPVLDSPGLTQIELRDRRRQRPMTVSMTDECRIRSSGINQQFGISGWWLVTFLSARREVEAPYTRVSPVRCTPTPRR